MIFVDRSVEFHGHRFVTPDSNALTCVREAYNQAARNAHEAGREVVQVEVILRVAPTEVPA